jgi:hypoxanthine phosphoribosyltransferase
MERKVSWQDIADFSKVVEKIKSSDFKPDCKFVFHKFKILQS